MQQKIEQLFQESIQVKNQVIEACIVPGNNTSRTKHVLIRFIESELLILQQ
jgi:hypothetical protein